VIECSGSSVTVLHSTNDVREYALEFFVRSSSSSTHFAPDMRQPPPCNSAVMNSQLYSHSTLLAFLLLFHPCTVQGSGSLGTGALTEHPRFIRVLRLSQLPLWFHPRRRQLRRRRRPATPKWVPHSSLSLSLRQPPNIANSQWYSHSTLLLLGFFTGPPSQPVSHPDESERSRSFWSAADDLTLLLERRKKKTYDAIVPLLQDPTRTAKSLSAHFERTLKNRLADKKSFTLNAE
jgi:hypothetical protein